MNLSPALQQAIEQIAAKQGISPDEFIVQTLMEKLTSLQLPVPADLSSSLGLSEKEGILVFETESLAHIDFNALIAHSREARVQESIDESIAS